jgi:DNA polymerase III subunit epsilon
VTERLSTPAQARELEAMAERLEASGVYRVLRAVPRPPRLDPPPPGARVGLYLDTETTGLDPAADAIIELGLVRFAYDDSGVLGSLDDLAAFEDPGRPIPPEVTALTGIDDAMVAGTRLPEERIAALFDGVHLVIAHNAGFDRPFVERRFPGLAGKYWACTWRDLPWRDAGFDGAKLAYLLMGYGHFFEGHRAVEDCYAGVHLLAQRWRDGDPDAGTSVMTRLREGALRMDVRLWAVGSPFETKDALRARGYRWNAAAKCWWRDVPKEELAAEKEWLRIDVYAGRLPARLPEFEIGAAARYGRDVPEAPP